MKISYLLIAALLFASSNVNAAGGGDDEDFNPGDMIMHHVVDAHEWEFWKGHGGTLYLPVILYSNERGIQVFSSSNFFDEEHHHVEYNGYLYDDGHIKPVSESEKIIDFSITKNVASLFFTTIVLLLVFFAVARGYKKNAGRPPKGIQSFFEPIIVFVRDDIVKPNIGPKYEKYLPYMLTLFFFIWFGNLIGLTPGAANLTGNIAVTLTLAVMTFLITNFSGNKAYWGHVFNTPGVPLPLKVIIVPVEILSLFTKPFSLMVRLFVAITAGHIVILSLIGLTFIFRSVWVGVGSTVIVLFINLIEILVATIQAYVFTMFSSLYIGMAVEEHH